MFTQISQTEKELIKKTGKLSLQINPFVDLYRKRERTEHIIIYSNKTIDHYPTSIFRCLVTPMVKCLLIEDLTIRTVGIEPIKENLLHLFLGWVIELVPQWAKELGKDHVFIQTKLSHCTEWFVEYEYNIRKINENFNYGFSGSKTIKGDFIL